jgi:hypothetical protein
MTLREPAGDFFLLSRKLNHLLPYLVEVGLALLG